MLKGLKEQYVASNQPSRDVQETDHQPLVGQQQQQQPVVLNEKALKKPVVEQPIAMQQPMKETPAVTEPQTIGPIQQEMEQPEVGSDEEQPQAEDDNAFEQARRFCKAKMNESFENGELAEVLRRVLPPTPEEPPPTLPLVPVGTLSPEAVEQVRVRLHNLLQSALQSGTLETAILELRVSDARIRLQNLLQSALQSGMLETAVRELLVSEAGGHEPFVSEVGGHGPFVSQVGGHGPAPDHDSSDVLQANARIRHVLEDGLQDGRLDGVFNSLRGDLFRRYANPQISAARDRMVQVLEAAIIDGSLEVSLEASLEASLETDLDTTFGQGNVVGTEQPGVVGTGEPNVLTAVAAGALPHRLEDTRKQLHSDLQSATRTGELQKALKAASEQDLPSDQTSRDVQVTREPCEGFGNACLDGQLEEKCSDCLWAHSDDSTQDQTINRMRDVLASRNFRSALVNRQTTQPFAVEQAWRPDSRPPTLSGPPGQRPPVRRSHRQDIVSLREQLKELKMENKRLHEKCHKLEVAMQ